MSTKIIKTALLDISTKKKKNYLMPNRCLHLINSKCWPLKVDLYNLTKKRSLFNVKLFTRNLSLKE